MAAIKSRAARELSKCKRTFGLLCGALNELHRRVRRASCTVRELPVLACNLPQSLLRNSAPRFVFVACLIKLVGAQRANGAREFKFKRTEVESRAVLKPLRRLFALVRKSSHICVAFCRPLKKRRSRKSFAGGALLCNKAIMQRSRNKLAKEEFFERELKLFLVRLFGAALRLLAATLPSASFFLCLGEEICCSFEAVCRSFVGQRISPSN